MMLPSGVMHCCLLFLITFHSCFHCIVCFDLTLEPESNGTDVVLACIAKIKKADIFTSDQQLLRRIAYVETRDGQDFDTYSNPNNHGGIWQLSATKYTVTKTSVSVSLTQSISTKFGITWSSTSWSDLRKPLYSALAARLYFEVITPSIPLSTDTNGQANYWVNYYTTSGGTTSDFVSAATFLKNYEECEVSGLDLIFIMDESGSIGSGNFQLMKNFVRDIVNSFDIGSDSVRVGVISYGSSYTFRFHLNTHFTKSSAVSAINNLPYNGGGTNTAAAINAARSIGFTTANGARPLSQGVPRIAMVITDGKSSSYSDTVSAASAMHNAGIVGFAIGIAGANTNELNAIASKQQYVDYLSNFDSTLLHNLQVTLSKEACEVSTEIKPNDTVNDTIPPGAVKHINFPLPDDYSGITLQVNVSAGVCTVFASTAIETPNEALHDIKLTTGGWEDTYFNQRNLSNPHAADKLYLTIKSTKAVENCTITLSIDEGDTSTEPVNVTSTPNNDVSMFFGSELVAECFATGKPQPVANWYKNGTALASNSSGLTVTQTVLSETAVTTRLTISSLLKNHEGTYTCIGSNIIPNGTVTDSSSFSVTVIGLIAVNFTGVALSSSAIYLSWDTPILKGIIVEHYVVECNEIGTNREWSFYAVESHAHIVSLHPYHYYRCKVQVVGNETYPFNLPITILTHQAAPSTPPRNIFSLIHSSSVMILVWSPPLVEHQNGIISSYMVQMTEVETNITTMFSSNSTSHILTSLHPYYSYVFRVAAVTVAVGPYSGVYTVIMPEDAPTSAPQNISVDVLSSTSVSIFWSPPPFEHQNGIIREYNITLFEKGNAVQRTEATPNTMITILYLRPYCEYQLTISAVTVQKGLESKVIKFKTLEDVPSGAPVMFNATTTSPYTANFTWLPPFSDKRNGLIIGYVINITNLETNETFSLYTIELNLIVNTLKPYRTYECTIAAQTSVGTGVFSTKFILITPADAPSSSPLLQSSSLSISSRGFYIRWQPPVYSDRNGVIQYYVIRLTQLETGTVYQFTIYSNHAAWTSLHPAYTYEFTIAAFTVALGPFSNSLNITLAEDVPSGSPNQLRAGSALSSSISLSWDPPSLHQQNGIIISYVVVVTSLDSSSRFNHTIYSATTITIQGLLPFTTYLCRVAAQTSIGVGPFTASITITTLEAAPTSPPVINGGYSIDSRTVVINWAPPPLADQNGIIRKYRVLMTNIKTGVNRTYIFSSTTATIGSLIPSFKYSFRVVAYTVADSPISTSITITMPEDVPSGYPVSINGNSSTPNSIDISWSPPADHEQNGVIIEYIINITHTDTLGLDPYTTYVCVVAARTNVGIGPFSNLFFIRTLEDAPDSAPFHASGIALDSTSIHITWDPPLIQDHNGLIREYRVNITEPGQQYFIQLVTNQTQIIVEHLEPYRVYHCYITAVTVDESPYTTAITVLTNEAAPSSPPQALFVSVVDSTSISMTWTPPSIQNQNGMIRSYLIKVMSTVRGATVNNDFVFSSGEPNFNTSLLHPFTAYSIQVAAVTVAAGPFTVVYNITTPQDVPSSAPEAFNASALSPTSILISWLPPAPSNLNGVLQYYILILFEVETRSSSVKNVTTSSIVIKDLHPFYLYKLTVSAVTIGEGPLTSTYIKMPESAPSAPPTSIVATNITSTAVHLAWDLIPDKNRNGIVRYYQVKITETDTNTEVAMVSISNELFVNDLHPYYTYKVSVAAYTVALGPYSVTQLYQMDEDVPSRPPTDFFGVMHQNFTVDFSWISPPLEEVNGILLGYNLTCKAMLTQHEVVISVLGTSYSIHRLQQATHYTCTVCAYTVKGCGPTATIHINTYESSPVGPPSSINVSVDTTMISLKWHSPFDPNSHILGYGITYQIIESIFPLETPRPPVTLLTDSTSTEYIIESLLSNTQYSIVVFAVFDEGTGPASDAIMATTKGEDYYDSVKDYRCLAMSSDSLKCSWQNPTSYPEDYNITELQLAYRLADGFDYYPGYGTELDRIVLGQTTEEYTIEGLKPYAGYIVELKCIMSNYIGSGDGEVSMLKDSEFETTESILSTFNTTQSILAEDTVKEFNVEVLSATSIEVSWIPPQRVHWNGIILSYNLISERRSPYAGEVGRRKRETTGTSVIKVVPQANHPDPSLASVPLKQERYLFTNLEENFQYHFSVGIINSKGVGAISDPFVQTMPESVPSGSPINIRAVNSTVFSITITWMPPNPIDANGVIIMYSLNITRPNILNTIHKQLAAQITFYEQQGLYAYENVSVSIAAMTTAGWGPYSEVYYFTTLEDEPGKPTALEAKLNNNGQSVTVNLTWRPPKRPNGVINGYQIIYSSFYRSRQTSGPFVLFVNSSNHMEVMVSNLNQGNRYEFTVRGRNGYGFGANSTAVKFIPSLNISVGKSSSKISDMATIIVPAVFGVVITIVVLLVIITVIHRKRKKSKRPVPRCEATNKLATENQNIPNFAELMNNISNKNEMEQNDYTSITFQANKTSNVCGLADLPHEMKEESKLCKSDCSL